MRLRSSNRMAAAAAQAATDSLPSLPEIGYFDNNMARCNETHIFFWSGVLSNWSRGPKYTGSRCFELMLPELQKIDVELPSQNTFSTRLIKDHSFNCGEQWMMALKGWFFERDLELAGLDVNTMTEQEFQSLKSDMYRSRAPVEWPEESRERAMWDSNLCRILREKNPRVQKEHGRAIQGFRDEVWSLVCIPCVVAACVARAENDPALRKAYLSNGRRHFVEGSPRDVVWGVGLHWKCSEIEEKKNWKGENRLGICHDKAALKIRELFPQGVSRTDIQRDETKRLLSLVIFEALCGLNRRYATVRCYSKHRTLPSYLSVLFHSPRAPYTTSIKDRLDPSLLYHHTRRSTNLNVMTMIIHPRTRSVGLFSTHEIFDQNH